MEKDNDKICKKNLEKLDEAFHAYDEYWGCLPPVWSSPLDSPETKLHSWRVLLLPYLGQKELYEKIRLDEPWNSEWNSQFHCQCPSVYQCPGIGDSLMKKGYTSYVLLYGPNSLFRGNRSLSFANLSDDALQRWDTSGSVNHRIKDSQGLCYLIEQTESINWMDPGHDFLLSDAVFTNDSPSGRVLTDNYLSLASKYYAPCHYSVNEAVGFYGWINALATEGRGWVYENDFLQKKVFELSDRSARKPEKLPKPTSLYRIKTKLSDSMHFFPDELYLVNFTPKNFQAMGDSGIRYTFSHERLDPEEREYLKRLKKVDP
ncbi:MAG: DUF1559 domain-containing protein [Planctomycetia bacterium]|nr:DUF1559 domain-containing protein [Planctomycetia bacterium]